MPAGAALTGAASVAGGGKHVDSLPEDRILFN